MASAARRLAPVAILGLLLVGAAVGFAGPAQAHNYLVSSTPAEGETLTELPEEFVITTNDELMVLGGQPSGFALEVTDSAGRYYGDGCVTVDGPSMSAVAAIGEPGDYTIIWQVISADGHTISDTIAFSWQPADTDAPVSEGRASPPVCGEASTTQSPEPEPEPTESTPEAADTAPDGANTDLLWIAGAIGAVAAAAAITMIVVSRKKKP